MRLLYTVMMLGAIGSAGCSSRAGTKQDMASVGPILDGAAGARSATGTGGSSGSAGITGGGGSAGSAGAVAPGGDAGLGSGGASGTIGGGGATATSGASGASVPAGPVPPLRIYGNTTTIELAPVLLAAQSIYPGKATVINGGIPNLFSPGGADIATNAETQALRQSVDHANLRIVFTVCEGFYRIVARRSSGIATLADLRGKKVATVPSTSSAYYLHKMLATVSLTESDVTIVPSSSPGAVPAALQSRQVDAVTIWEPEIQNAADMIGSDAIEFQDRSVYRELFNLHATVESLNDATIRAGIVEFVRALITASEQIRNMPQDVWPLVAKTTNYDQQLVAKVWNNEGYPGTMVSDLLDVLEQEETWVAQQSSRAPRPRAKLAEMIDGSVLQEALAKH